MRNVYNIKMRAAQGGSHEEGGRHISGAERIIAEKDIKKTLEEMVQRALNHSKGKADFINISLNKVEEKEIHFLKSLPVTTVKTSHYQEGRKVVIKLLNKLGLDLEKCQLILATLEKASPMRGAILLDINSLQRLEKDQSRGVRATGMDWEEKALSNLQGILVEPGCYNLHSQEAIALATKVAHGPGIVAEICWSDDPDYVAGYVASKDLGYVRITNLKPLGDDKGGRIFCFDSSRANLQECLHWIEEEVILINDVGLYRGTKTATEMIGEKVC